MSHQSVFTKTETASPGASHVAWRIYSDLRDRIIGLELRPDTTISRKELATRNEVSLTPVREALQKLEQEGLVRIFPQSKTVVTRIDRSALYEAQFMRVALETEVARRLAERHDTDLVSRIRSILKLQNTLSDDIGQVELFNELDRAFHRTMFEALNLQATHTLLQSRLGHLARCQKLELPRAGKMQEIMAAHTAIVEGIEAGDPERAAAAMRGHVTGTISRISILIEENPDYFQ